MPRPQRTTGQPINDAASPARVRLNLVLAVVAALGAAIAGWTLSNTSSSGRVAEQLGMTRVASNWEHILSILALPALMFFLILLAWAGSELFRAYRLVNDPERYRRARGRDHQRG